MPDGDLGRARDLEPDRRVTRKMVHDGYVDVAWDLFQQTWETALLWPTGTDDWLDQAWVSGPLAAAVLGYRVLDQPERASNHHGLVFTLAADLISREDLWEYQ